MADSGARANVGVSKLRGRMPRMGLLQAQRTLNLRADIKKLEAEMASRDIGDGAFHDASQSMIDIAKADLGAGNKSYMGTLAAQEAAKHIEKALNHAKKSQEVPKEALKSSRKALKAVEEAKVWLEVHCTLMDAGEADEETQAVQDGINDARLEEKARGASVGGEAA